LAIDAAISAIPGWHVGVLYPLAGCRRAPRRIFFLRIFTGGAGRWPSYGSAPKAGRSRGKLMAWHVGVLYPLAGCRRAPRRISFLRNSPAALAAGRATG